MPTPDTLEAGQVVTHDRTFTREEVEQFADLSGDEGYHHLVAESSGEVMVHGLLTATLPTKIGGDIDYVARTMEFDFPRPVYTGETITCELTLEEVQETEGRTELDTSWVCRNEDDEVVMTGSSSGVVFG
jgi:acyl dehydratase